MDSEALASRFTSGAYPHAIAIGTRLRRDWLVRTVRPLPSQGSLSELQQVVEDAVFAFITDAYLASTTPQLLAAVRPSLCLVRLDEHHLVVRTEFVGPETSIGDTAAIAQLGALQRIDQEIEFDDLQGLPAASWFWLKAARELRESTCSDPGGCSTQACVRGCAMAAEVHPTAIVEDGAEIGDGVKIWHWVHVRAGARIGEGTSIGQGCYVGAVEIGRGCRIQNHVSIYDGVTIEDDVFLGPSCVFTNVKHPRANVSRKRAYERTVVGRGATVGANATIVCGVTIGAYAMIGAGAVVTGDVPAHGLMIGSPARRVGWACRCGETLPRGVHVQCGCGDAYELSELAALLVAR